MPPPSRDLPPDLLEQIRDTLRYQVRLGLKGVPIEHLKEPLNGPAPAAPTPSFRSSSVAVERPMSSPKTQGSLLNEPKRGVPSGTLDEIRDHLGDCRRCKLHEGRQNIVFGEGNPNATIMFVGEGPGEDEDKTGRPFVGRAGQLLTRWIELGMGISRSDVYIGNIVKCRPPANRVPEPDEVNACIGFIEAQIEAIRPKVLVLLGRTPLMNLLGVKEGITKVHGVWFEWRGIPTMALFHPSYCLRPPLEEKKKLVWEDIKKLLAHLNMPIPKKST